MAFPLNRLIIKLSKLRAQLRYFNKEVYGVIVTKYILSIQNVANIRQQLQSNPLDPFLTSQERDAIIQFGRDATAYEKFLHQKSKVIWLRLGDECSGYFHVAMKSRNSLSRILSYIDNGIRMDNFQLLVSYFLNHFKPFTGIECPLSAKLDMNYVAMGPSLSIDQQLSLIKPFSDKEIKEAIFSIGRNESPGLDGFGAGFFKASRNLISGDVTAAVRDFFSSSKLPKTVTSTLLVLIPKSMNPSNVKDYRPIACCSTLYKCISKLICNRLSSVLPFLVNENQGAFIRRRSLIIS